MRPHGRYWLREMLSVEDGKAQIIKQERKEEKERKEDGKRGRKNGRERERERAQGGGQKKDEELGDMVKRRKVTVKEWSKKKN